MRLSLLALFTLALQAESLPDRTQRYLIELIRLNTSNAPGNETLVAKYVQEELKKEGITSELLGADPNRLNIVARLKGSGTNRPLLLMAHSDVVPVEPKLWTVPAFDAVQ
jgi:acetylornithine deacetylase/succinyl-diaminopimelate desuccinylase-like protein